MRRVADLCAALGGPLIPLDIEIKYALDIWLAFDPDAKKIAWYTIDWTVQGFDGGNYPWFCDKFVHLRELQEACKETGPLANLFAGFKKYRTQKSSELFLVA